MGSLYLYHILWNIHKDSKIKVVDFSFNWIRNATFARSYCRWVDCLLMTLFATARIWGLRNTVHLRYRVTKTHPATAVWRYQLDLFTIFRLLVSRQDRLRMNGNKIPAWATVVIVCLPSLPCATLVVGASWNVMAHAQKPDFIFWAKRTSPFKSAGGGVSSVDYWQPRCAHQR